MTSIRVLTLTMLFTAFLRPLYAHNGAVAIAVPIEGIVVDGDLSDWPEGLRRYPITHLSMGDRPADRYDFEAFFRVGYNAADSALYVAVEVQDESRQIELFKDEPWVRWWELRDGCEVYVDLEHRAVDSPSVQSVIHGQVQRVYGTLATMRHDGGHRYEWRLGLTEILAESYMHAADDDPSLHSGMTVGFDVSVGDRDDDGTLSWMTWGSGALKYRNTSARGNLILSADDEFAFFSPVTGGEKQRTEVRCITQDLDGVLWIGTWDGVVCFDRGQFTDPGIGDALHGLPVNSILQDQQGNMWFGTAGYGVVRYDGREAVSITAEDGLAANMVLSMLQDRQGRMWFGTLGGGISRLDGDEFKNFGVGDGLPGIGVFDIVEDQTGNLWFGTEKGVASYNGQVFSSLTVADGLVHDLVKTIVEDGEGILWFGTLGGVSRYDGQNFTNFTMDDALAANSVSDIIADHAGQLWIGFNEVRVNLYDGLTFQVIKRDHGLLAESIGCLFEDRHDDIWIGTDQGLIRYRPRHIPPSVAITTVTANRQYESVHEIAVPSTQDYLSFEYLGISRRSDQDEMVYAYRLVGSDAEWRSTQQRRVEYEDLPVGDYEFQVRAVDRDLTYSVEPASVKVAIHPPYGQIALAGLLAASVLGLATATSYGIRRRRERDIARVRLVRDLEEELQAAHDMQMGLMPSESPQIAGLEAAGECLAATHVGGDTFQFFAQEDRFFASVADVTGHAMEAALPAVMFSGILDNQMEQPPALPTLCNRLNRSLFRSLGSHKFICFTMAEIEGKTLRLASCGNPYPLHFHNGCVTELSVDGYPLGVREDTQYNTTEAQLQVGDYLVLYSDGIPETVNPSEEMFGYERTIETVREGCAKGISAEDLVEQLMSKARAFAGEEPQADDMTCVVVRVEA
jgi:hypothetical protein